MDLKTMAEASWAARGTFSIIFDPRRCDVSVPPQFRAMEGLRLDWPLNGVPAIPDLAIDDYGVRGSLSFRGERWPCLVPWAAVVAMTGADGRIEHVAADVRSTTPEPVTVRAFTVHEGGGQTPPPRRPALRLIQGGASPCPPSEPAPLLLA
jgi:hypothetical protein